jgi:hypothetical protein
MRKNISQQNENVKNFIKPTFNCESFYFESDDLCLEDQISSFNSTDHSQHLTEDQIRFTVNKCPELIRSTIHHLRGRHETLPSQAAVQRFLTRAGVIILERIAGLKDLNQKRRSIYETGTEKDRLEFINRFYDLGYRISLTAFPMTIYCWQWVGSKITEISSDLGLPQEMVVIQSLIAGMSTSERWVPRKYQTLMFDEAVRFAQWVDELSKKI